MYGLPENCPCLYNKPTIKNSIVFYFLAIISAENTIFYPTMYRNATGSADLHLDKVAYHKLVQLTCFLRELCPLYDPEDLDDSESDSSLVDFQGTEALPGTEAELRQTLVDAVAFAASADRAVQHVVAVAVEELDSKERLG